MIPQNKKLSKRRYYQRSVTVAGIAMFLLTLFYTIYLLSFDASLSGNEQFSFCVTITMVFFIMLIAFFSRPFFVTNSGINFEYRFVYVISRRMFVSFEDIESLSGSRSNGLTVLTKSGSRHLIKTTDMTKGDIKQLYNDLFPILADRLMLDNTE